MKYKISRILQDEDVNEICVDKSESYRLYLISDCEYKFSNNEVGIFDRIDIYSDNYIYIYFTQKDS